MIRSVALRNSARGQDCTVQIPGICNCDPSTTILAHLPDESHGMGLKAADIAACWACSGCHDVLDKRDSRWPGYADDLEWYMRRAQTRTLKKWIELGLVTIKGVGA